MLKLFKNNRGASAIEYGLIAALIAVTGIAAFQAIGGNNSKNQAAQTAGK